jgi:hypothetical protein
MLCGKSRGSIQRFILFVFYLVRVGCLLDVCVGTRVEDVVDGIMGVSILYVLG